ncbi:single-stranded-DNA-specific exonuclease RecJ [Virgibacillus salexigens]|uniref:single-stranded-DNA-specific exonuclease RecJ n=1 Tax=Virgibacillus salexigens TaxID=61016 RepID=UPI00190C89D4|nr:single-stranded-DNA-specific exonuclease RecJ [Virgibacillus salexigens]
MLKSKAKWNYIEKIQDNDNLHWMDDSLSLSPVIQELLLQRGITSEHAASKFLAPDLSDLHNPNMLLMIDKATNRVHQAIENQERILVFGDYDADGVSSTTVLLKALQELGADCNFYIPNRFTEGYGPNEKAFRNAYDEGYQLIITVDTGIAAVHEAEVANELGIDLIITDHHEIQAELPDCYAIIHPKCSPDYLFQELAGVGVAFKFAESLLGYFPKHLLEFTAIGTIADLVPLVNENRILAYYGLKALSATSNVGLKALKQVCKIEDQVTEEDVGFLIGPRINAVGRLQDADLAVHLLMTDSKEEAIEIAETIQQINQERQRIVTEIVNEAEEMLNGCEQQGVIIVAKEGWNEGVLGIVASKLVRKYDRPAIVLAKKSDKGIAKGSARSIPAFDLFQNCMQVRHLFHSFGGHAQAAGMTLQLEQVEVLQAALNELIFSQLTAEDFKQVIDISQSIPISEITEELIGEIERLAPFGMHNPKPLFHIQEQPTQARQIGSLKNHLKLQFKSNKAMLDAIGFGLGELFHYLTPHTAIQLVGELGINEWNGQRKPQMMIQDISINDWQLFDHRGKRTLDISPFINEESRQLAVGKEERTQYEGINYKTYQDLLDDPEQLNSLFIIDMPNEIADLEQLIKNTKPNNIHVCYYVKDSTYLRAFPSREEFKWVYAFILRRKQLHADRDITVLIQSKGWTKDKLLFILDVFEELDFISNTDGIIQPNPQPMKKDLRSSSIYQQRLRQAEIEKVLYYSTYEELKSFFTRCAEYLGIPKEELSYGL